MPATIKIRRGLASALAAATGAAGEPLWTTDTHELWICTGSGTTKYQIGGAGSGTVTSVDITAPSAGITVSGGPVTSSGSITLALADDLAALEGLTGTGFAKRTGANTWTLSSAVSLTADVSGILPAANGGTGNGFTAFTGPTTSTKTFTLPNASATILTDAAAVTVAQGGTGQTSFTNGQLLIGNSTGNTLTKATLTAGTGIAVTNGGGSITISVDSDLATFATLAGYGFVTRAGSGWVQRLFTFTEGITINDGYGLTGDVVISPADDLAGLEALTGTGRPKRTGPSAWALAAIDLTAEVTGILPAANGGTGNGFAAFTGPTTSTKTFTLPNATCTILTTNAAVTVGQGGTGQTSFTDGQLLIGNSTGNTLTKATLTAGTGIVVTNGGGSITVATDPATQSDQETGTDTAKPVTPGRQHFHPSAAKGWVKFTISGGTVTVRASRNVSSVTRGSAGVYTVNWDTDFSSEHYAVVGSAGLSGSVISCYVVAASTFMAGSAQVATYNTAGTLTDADVVCVVAFGDQ